MDRWILTMFGTLLVCIACVWLLLFTSRRKTVAKNAQGVLVLTHSRLFCILSVALFLGLLLLVATLAMWYPPVTPVSITLCGLAILTILILGVVLMWDAFQYSLTITSKGLDCISPWRGKRFIAWNDVKQIDFSDANLWFGVQPHQGPVFHVSVFVPGCAQFLGECEANLKTEQLAPAVQGYPWVWRALPAGVDKYAKPTSALWLWTKRLALGCLSLLLFGVGLFCLNGLVLASGEKPIAKEVKVVFKSKTGADQAKKQVVVFSYNIAKAFAHKSGLSFASEAEVHVRLDAMAVRINSFQPDIVCLSECMTEAGFMPVDQVEYLARATGMPYTLFGENYNFGVPGYRVVGGNAILSRTPIKPIANISLAGRQPFYVTKNSRRALFGEVELHGEKVLVGSLHNDSYNPANNLKQMEQIIEFVGDQPTILAGDFNAEPDSPSLKAIENSGRFINKLFEPAKENKDGKETVAAKLEMIPTFPSDSPSQAIDFIFGPKHWKVIENGSIHGLVKLGQNANQPSDHLPIYSLFEIGEKK